MYERKIKIARSKFNVSTDKNNRTFNGIAFDSALEMKFYRDYVCPKYENGEIKEYQLQVKYELQPKFVHKGKTVQAINYVADFVLTYSDGTVEVIDTKGFPDSTALLKRKLFWYKYPEVSYKWITYVKKYGGWIEYDEYKKLKQGNKPKKA